MLEELFGKPPERILDLDLSVALGAAYQAVNCERAQRAQSPTSPLQLLPGGLIVDCVSYPVGIAILNASGNQLVKLVMLHPGDPLDTWSSLYAVRIANTAGPLPPIAVYKGEDPQLEPSDYLGDIAVPLPPGTVAGARATIRMLQDQSGIVQIQIAVNEQAIAGNFQRAQR
jgi:molecular chaperone DnaK (HSP70)